MAGLVVAAVLAATVAMRAFRLAGFVRLSGRSSGMGPRGPGMDS